ncbi:tellurite resistance TerB family protein [Frankia sp. CiP3]|uniref:tellurite resistance TerB family protein n=1 Tax=Frankia sp. CiP3 TaxID=2880971 RepID=UPI001EF51440|nr:TerB family tellurite resistance protein [Frankia sp. CiP3]
MPVPTNVRLDVRILLSTGTHLVVRYVPAESAHALPGGTVAPGEDVVTAASRHLRGLLGSHRDAHAAPPQPGPVPPGLSASPAVPAFAACVEHATGPDERTMTLVFSADLPGKADLPTAYLGTPLVTLPLTNLTERSLTPPAIASMAIRWLEDRWPTWSGLAVSEPEPWWSQLRESAHSLRAQLDARRHEFTDASFRDAAVAMCALVAAADGTIDAREREAMAAIVTSDPVLGAFPPDELLRLFDAHVAAFRADATEARAAALREIAKVRGRRVRARSVIQFGAVIGRADGTFDPAERAAIQQAIAVLGLDPMTLAVQAG